MPTYCDDSKENGNDSSSNQSTILLVDDDPMVIDMLECVIQAHGFQVVIATDGFEACRTFLAKPERFDLVVSDVQMPNMNGVEAYKIMVQVNPKLRSIFMSGYLSGIDVFQEIQHFKPEYISKPFSPSHLIGKICEVLAETD